MAFIDSFLVVLPYIPNIIMILSVLVLAIFANFLTDKIYSFLRKKFNFTAYSPVKLLIKFFIYLVAILLVLLNIPGLTKNMMQLVGIVFGGIVAFSSTTIIANGMSGLILKWIKQYQINDVIEFV